MKTLALLTFHLFVCFDGDDKRMTGGSASPRAASDYCLPEQRTLIILPRHQGALLQVHVPAVHVTHEHTNRQTDTHFHTQKHSMP